MLGVGASAVLAGSLWYSNGRVSRSKYTVPTSPGGSSRPASSQMCATPIMALPTEPRLVSHSGEEMNVMPFCSVEP